MKKRGFTLIELLAVIVILAVIALIATPIVMNTIEESRRKSAEVSMGNIEAAADLYYMNNRLDGSIEKTTFTCEEGACSNGIDTLEINGTVPDEGTITIETDGTVTFNNIIIGKYLCSKTGDTFACSKTEGKVNETYSGSIITLNNTKDSTLLNYKLYGNSVQETYIGNNISTVNYGYVNRNQGATVVIGENVYFECEPNTTYTLSYDLHEIVENSELRYRFRLDYYDENKTLLDYGATTLLDSDGSIEYVFTTPENTKFLRTNVQYTPASTAPIEFELNNIMVNKGSTKLSYEPYVGGKPSPNPEYPQEIKTVGNLVTEGEHAGKYEIPITVTGKNLFDVNGLEIGTIDGLGNNSSNNTRSRTNYIFFKPGTYIFSKNQTEKAYTKAYKYDLDKNQIGFIWNNTWNTYTFTIEEDCYIKFAFDDSIDIINNANVQIEKGAIATSYEPYKGTDYSIYLDEPLRKVGDYADYIDFEKGQVVRNIGNIILKGTTNIKTNPTVLGGYKTYQYVITTSNWLGETPVLSSKLPGDKNWDSGNSLKREQISMAAQVLTLRIAESRGIEFSSTGIKAWLGENNIDVWYPLKTPDDTERIELPQIKLNSGVTNIIIGTETAPSSLVIDYYK